MEWLKGRQPMAGDFLAMGESAAAGNIALSLSRINYGEVVYCIRKDIPEHLMEASLKAFQEIPIQLHSVDDLLVDEAVMLKSVYRISYADAFALGLRLDVPVVTGDPEFLNLQVIGLKLHWMGT
jgi:predicted nucleic acid-binding protein